MKIPFFGDLRFVPTRPKAKRPPAARGGGGPVISAGFGSTGANGGVDAFDALGSTQDRSPISATSLSVFRMMGMLPWTPTAMIQRRETLAAYARFIADNYSIATYALQMMQNYSVPVVPKPSTADQEWNRLAEEYFDDWSDRCDFFGRHDFATLQELMCSAIDIDGDLGVTMDTSHGWPQVRCWPTWRIGQLNGLPQTRMCEGVLLGEDDSVLGYQVVMAPNDYRIVNANQCLLLYEPERFERYRGLSAMRAGMNDLRDQQDIKGFVKLGAKVQSALAAVIQGSAGEAVDWSDPAEDDEKAGSGANPPGMKIADLYGGDIPVIDGELKQLSSTGPAANNLEFLDQLAGFFVSGMGLPPAFVLDWKHTGPNVRATNGKAQKRFDKRKRTMTRFAKWVWVRVIADAIDKGALPPAENWQRCRFQTPPLLSIDLGDQADANAKAYAEGRISRQRYFGDQGLDWRDEVGQVLLEDEYILGKVKELATSTGLPVEVIMARHGFTPLPPAQKPDNQKPDPNAP